MRLGCGVLLVLVAFQLFSQTTDSGQLQFEAALKQLNDSAYSEALHGFDKLMSTGFPEIKIYPYRGEAKFNLGDYQGATEDLGRAVRMDENQSANFFRMLGISKYQLLEWEAAKYFLNKAVQKGSNDPQVYLYLGIVCYKGYQYKEALEALNAAALAGEKEMQLFQVRGMSAYYLKDYAQAIRDLDKVSKEGTPVLLTLESLGLSFASEKNFKAALSPLQQADSLGSKNKEVYFQLGNCYLESDAYDKAIESYSKSIALDFKDEQVFNQRGLARMKKGMFTEALADFDKAYKIRPGYTPTLRNRAQVCYQLGEWGRVITDLTLANAMDDTQPDDWAWKSEARYQLHDFKGALDEVQKAKKAGTTGFTLNDKKHTLSFQEGKCLAGLREFEPALDAFEKALAQGEDSPEFFIARARTYAGLHQKEKVINDLNRAQSMEPNNADLFFNSATIKEEVGETVAAIGDMGKAIVLDANNSLYYKTRGDYYYQIKDKDNACVDWRKAIALGDTKAQSSVEQYCTKK